MDTNTYAITSIALLSLLIIAICVYTVFLLKASRFNTTVYMPFLARQFISQNLTPTQKYYRKSTYLTIISCTVMGLATFLHNKKIVALIFLVLIVLALTLVIINIPSSIKGNLMWYRALSPGDRNIYWQHVRYGFVSIVGAFILLSFLLFMGITLK